MVSIQNLVGRHFSCKSRNAPCWWRIDVQILEGKTFCRASFYHLPLDVWSTFPWRKWPIFNVCNMNVQWSVKSIPNIAVLYASQLQNLLSDCTIKDELIEGQACTMRRWGAKGGRLIGRTLERQLLYHVFRSFRTTWCFNCLLCVESAQCTILLVMSRIRCCLKHWETGRNI